MSTSDGSAATGTHDGPPPLQIPSTVADLERELKFIVPNSRAGVVRSLLYSLCRPDRTYPPARVVSVYFDSAGLDRLDEKINSDYRKSKVRVRWYESIEGGVGDPLYVECKYRVGSRRKKLRVRATRKASEVSEWPLERLEWMSLLDGLRAAGADIGRELQPILRLRYVRERFTDVLGDGRLTLDTDIGVDAVNPRRVRPGLLGPMRAAVLEYKGAAAELPAHLRVLVRAGARKASYSKYLAANLHVTQGAI